MIVQIDGQTINIYGKCHGQKERYKKYLRIRVSEENGKDRFKLCLCTETFEKGVLPSITIDEDYVSYDGRIVDGHV